jgi:hypothetical protein
MGTLFYMRLMRPVAAVARDALFQIMNAPSEQFP